MIPRFFFLGVLLICFASCNSEPPIYPVTGKVTLGGESFERLLVYLRPLDTPVSRFNLGVGSTDADGQLTLGSGAGDGVAAGKYRVSFSCMITPKGTVADLDTKEGEDGGDEPREAVPPPYDFASNGDSSPIEFEVTKNGENILEFDIPVNE